MQQQITEADVEATQARVTPHELAQATAIVEARREAEAKHLADTIALGEAVQQLGLAATPEELFAEVQALRANAPQNNTKIEATQLTAKPRQISRKKAAAQIAYQIAYQCLVMLLIGTLFIKVMTYAVVSSVRCGDAL